MTVARPIQGAMFPEHSPERPVGPIPASVQTGTNADLIAKIAPLYLTGSVLDVTYGEGKWWGRFTPDPFTFHDLHKVDGVDFRALPHPDGSFDAVCFDPPYIVSGVSAGSMADGDFQQRYGVGSGNLGHASPAQFESLLRDGLAEAERVARCWVLVKCMEFTVSGRFHDIPFRMRRWGEDAGLKTHDVIVHHTGSGPGGHNIFDVKRARRHHSYLLVFRVPALFDGDTP